MEQLSQPLPSQLKSILDTLDTNELQKLLRDIGYTENEISNLKDKDTLIGAVTYVMSTNTELSDSISSLVLHPTITRISGPVSWSMYKYRGMNIHIFGDYHGGHTGCSDDSISIDSLFKVIARRSVVEEQVVNTFLESPFVSRCSVRSSLNRCVDDNYLKDISNTFSSCLTRRKKDCPYYPFWKIHYSDIRLEGDGSTMNGLIGFLHAVFSTLYRKPITYEAFSSDPAMSTCTGILNELVLRPRLFYDITIGDRHGKDIENGVLRKIHSNYPISDLYKTGTRTHRVKWQLMNINPVIAGLIENYIGKQYDLEVKVLVDLVITRVNESVTNFSEWLGKLFRAVIFTGVCIVDAYVLARMFRVMDWDVRSKLMMVYVGNTHKNRYDTFFTDYLDMKPVNMIQRDENIQCLESSMFNSVFGSELFK